VKRNSSDPETTLGDDEDMEEDNEKEGILQNCSALKRNLNKRSSKASKKEQDKQTNLIVPKPIKKRQSHDEKLYSDRDSMGMRCCQPSYSQSQGSPVIGTQIPLVNPELLMNYNAIRISSRRPPTSSPRLPSISLRLGGLQNLSNNDNDQQEHHDCHHNHHH